MFLWFKKLQQKFNVWHARRTTAISEKGQYAAYYIMDKYLLETNPNNYIATYEDELINIVEKKMIMVGFFEHFAVLEQLEVRHNIAAFFALVKLLIFSSNEEREKMYDYLKDYKNLSILKEYVKRNIIF